MRHADRRPSRGNLSLSLSRSGHTGLFPLSVMGMIHSVDSKNRPERRERARAIRTKRTADRRRGRWEPGQGTHLV